MIYVQEVPTNYRPISLTSVFCRMLESIIKDKIMAHFDTNHFSLSNITTWFQSYDVIYYTVTTCNGTLDQEFE